MDMAMVEVINVVGFPIAVAIALFWLNRETIQANKETEKELRNALEQNTQVMREVLHQLKGQRNDL